MLFWLSGMKMHFQHVGGWELPEKEMNTDTTFQANKSIYLIIVTDYVNTLFQLYYRMNVISVLKDMNLQI